MLAVSAAKQHSTEADTKTEMWRQLLTAFAPTYIERYRQDFVNGNRFHF